MDRFQLLIPANYPIVSTWADFAQLKAEGNGNGPFALSFVNGKLALAKSTSQTYGTTADIANVWTSPMATVRGQWIKLLLNINWSTGSDGFYQLWGDLADGAGFHQLKAPTPGWTLKFNASGAPNPVGARIGIYRATVAQDSTIYFTGYTVATTQYDAMLKAFGFPPPPAASFTAIPSTGTAPLSVQFADTSTEQPTSWSWTFGDGATSTAQNPTHSFTTPGTYTVTMTATNAGGSSTTSQTTTVNAPAPAASFTSSPASGTAPLSVQFTDTSTGSPTSWSWNFGDGSTSTAQNPGHAYTSAGTYIATLTASNAGGASSPVNQTITVNVSAPAAGFTASPTGGTAPLTAQFTDTSVGNPTSWAWSFGDGTTSTAQNPTHSYAAGGPTRPR